MLLERRWRWSLRSRERVGLVRALEIKGTISNVVVAVERLVEPADPKDLGLHLVVKVPISSSLGHFFIILVGGED